MHIRATLMNGSTKLGDPRQPRNYTAYTRRWAERNDVYDGSARKPKLDSTFWICFRRVRVRRPEPLSKRESSSLAKSSEKPRTQSEKNGQRLRVVSPKRNRDVPSIWLFCSPLRTEIVQLSTGMVRDGHVATIHRNESESQGLPFTHEDCRSMK